MHIEIEDISIEGAEAYLKGRCNVEIQTWFEHDGPEISYYVPCRSGIECQLNNSNEWEKKDHTELKFDTSQLDR